VSWWLGTISKQSPGNWSLCKEVGLFGIPGERSRISAQPGDRLLVWMGGKGYIAEARVIGDVRIPANRSEAPWGGGTMRFSRVVPIEVVTEVRTPVRFPFEGQVQTGTGFNKNMFLHSFVSVTDAAADVVVKALEEASARERAQTP